MLTSEQLANLVDSITPAYSAYEQDIARKLCKAIERLADRNEALSEWHKSYMQEAERLYKEIQEQTKALTTANESEIAGTLATAANKSIEFDQTIYRAAGRTALELSEMSSARRLLLAGIDKTNGLIGNLTRTTAKTAHDIFISACSTAEMQVTSGAFDYNTAIRNAIKQASGDGRYITYSSGHRDSVDVAVRRAVLTGISQTTGLLSIYHAQEMDCDLMQISAHYGARPEHAEWQGKIVSLSGFTVGYLTLEDIGYGTGEGFKGWNCRHDWYPYFEGISVNQYSDEQLDEYANKLVYYDGNYIPYYEATQTVRRQERRIRKLSREAAGLDTKYTAAELEQKKQLLKQHKKALKDFCEQTGLTARPQSMRVIGSSGTTFSKSANSKLIPITKESIKKIPIPNCKRLTREQNAKMHLHCQEILESVYDDVLGTEAGMTLSMDADKLKYKKGDPGAGLISMKPEKVPYIFLHNHPDCNIFSAKDIRNFINIDNMQIISAIGHDGKMYILEKLPEYDVMGVRELFADIVANNLTLEESIQDYINVIEYFLEGAKEYGIGVYY